MKQKLFLAAIFSCTILIYAACGNSGGDDNTSGDSADNASNTAGTEGTDPKGIGKFRNVELTHPLDENMVASGKNVYEVKCASCHKLSDERIVGPGWKGVTDRRTPEWIMNFVTNVDEMLEKDTASQTMLEQCLVRMPNQGLSDDDARHVLEYMRKNDGKN